MATKTKKPFGTLVREKRTAKGISLRKFAALVGVSATYLSQVEQGNCDPPRILTDVLLHSPMRIGLLINLAVLLIHPRTQPRIGKTRNAPPRVPLDVDPSL